MSATKDYFFSHMHEYSNRELIEAGYSAEEIKMMREESPCLEGNKFVPAD